MPPTASGEPDATARETRDCGSVLLLFPAGILIVLLLGSLAVDSALIHLRQRELMDAATAAASDAANIALDVEHYRATGQRRLDAARAVRAARESLAAREILVDLAAPPRIRLRSIDEVEVHLELRVVRIFGSLVPAGRRSIVVTATGIARASSP